MKNIVYGQELLILKALERGLPNLGIDNLLNFWKYKIRKNSTEFFACQNLLIIIDEIDQKITKIESKKESIDKKKQKESNSSIKGRTTYQYRPINIGKDDINKNIRDTKYEINKNRDNKNIRDTKYDTNRDNKNIKDEKYKININRDNNIKDTKYEINKNRENKNIKDLNYEINKNRDNKNIKDLNYDINKNRDNKNYSRVNERKSNSTAKRNIRNTRNETKPTKPTITPEKNKKEYLNNINNLQNNSFNYQEEKLGQNILEISKKGQNIISFIDIDLFLQRIAQEKKIYDDLSDNDILLNGICIQHPIFIITNTFISKIITCFNYFYSKYLNQDSEKDSNQKSSQTINRRATNDYRSRYKHVRENKKPENDIFDSYAFEKTLKKIPYNLIDLLILFVDLHEKYSKETLTKEIIDKIENFYRNMLDIYDVKNKYKDDIDYSSRKLKSIKTGTILRRVKTQGRKLEYEELFSNKYLLSNIIRDPEKPLSFFNILEYDSKDIARELTRISYHIFSQIQPKEFFKGVFTKKTKDITSPNLTKITNRFNQISFWLTEEILSYDHESDRGEIIEKFIDIAGELNDLNNFNDCMSLVSGLGSMIITGLAKSWKYVSKESNNVLVKLKKVVNFQDNYKNMREKIEECLQNNEPYIPFLGPYNKRICFLEEYGPYVKETSLINVDKIVLVQQIFDQIYKFKNKKYDFIRNPKKEFAIFQCLDPASEEELEKLSSCIEPNFNLSNKKTHLKRITNTEIKFKENYDRNDNIV